MSIAGTMLLMHLGLGATSYFAIQLLLRAEREQGNFDPRPKLYLAQLHGLTLLFFIGALACVVFDEVFVGIWRQLFPGLTIPSLPTATSRLLFFLMQLAWATVLVRRTGGARDSPFVPLLSGIPALAIFLGEPPLRFVIYTLISAAGYLSTLYRGRPISFVVERRPYKDSIALVMIMMLIIGTLTAYVTFPR